MRGRASKLIHRNETTTSRLLIIAKARSIREQGTPELRSIADANRGTQPHHRLPKVVIMKWKGYPAAVIPELPRIRIPPPPHLSWFTAVDRCRAAKHGALGGEWKRAVPPGLPSTPRSCRWLGRNGRRRDCDNQWRLIGNEGLEGFVSGRMRDLGSLPVHGRVSPLYDRKPRYHLSRSPEHSHLGHTSREASSRSSPLKLVLHPERMMTKAHRGPTATTSEAEAPLLVILADLPLS